ncbi:MAG: GNAT family N-acetyltransferase [Chloroflexota bacterium]|nr:GNAT family N-acetyltransferase [Chloroflexota bacterium]
MAILIRDMQAEDEAFVGTCTHVDETEEWTASCERRVPWLRHQRERGLRVKVALLDGEHAGFLYMMPIEVAPWGPAGRDLMSIQCLTVRSVMSGQGVGRALVEAAEEEARVQECQSLVVTAFYHDFWFMPAPFFEKCGFTVAARKDSAAILWKPFSPSAEPPHFLERNYEFVPVPDKVAIDLFWSRSCLTTDTEAQRVREVAEEFGDAVALRAYCADDPTVRDRYGVPRGIFIEGEEVGWGYEAPREGLREAIRAAMAAKGGKQTDGEAV